MKFLKIIVMELRSIKQLPKSLIKIHQYQQKIIITKLKDLAHNKKNIFLTIRPLRKIKRRKSIDIKH